MLHVAYSQEQTPLSVKESENVVLHVCLVNDAFVFYFCWLTKDLVYAIALM